MNDFAPRARGLKTFEASLVNVSSHTSSDLAAFHFCIWEPETELAVDISGEPAEFRSGRFLSEEEANRYLAALLSHNPEALQQALEAVQNEGRVTVRASGLRGDVARDLGWNNGDPAFRAR